MRIDRKLNILGHIVGVYFVDEPTIRTLTECKENDATPEGFCDIPHARIYMLEGPAPCRLTDTLVHEVGHYFINVSGLRRFFEKTLRTKDYGEWEEDLLHQASPCIALLMCAGNNFLFQGQNNAKDST